MNDECRLFRRRNRALSQSAVNCYDVPGDNRYASPLAQPSVVRIGGRNNRPEHEAQKPVANQASIRASSRGDWSARLSRGRRSDPRSSRGSRALRMNTRLKPGSPGRQSASARSECSEVFTPTHRPRAGIICSPKCGEGKIFSEPARKRCAELCGQVPRRLETDGLACRQGGDKASLSTRGRRRQCRSSRLNQSARSHLTLAGGTRIYGVCQT